jgi:hypothetical protein
MVALLFVAGLTLAGEGKSGSWSGYVTDTICGAEGASADHASCAKKCVEEHGAKYALYNTADKKVYVLDPQDKVAEHAGHEVTIKGTLDGETIHVTSISMNEAKGD